jgi:4-alpha-glucanotransferase
MADEPPPAPAPDGPLAVRRAGVLLHVTSLPSAYGAGDLGPAARRFVDFLEAAGCTVWQVLPLVPTHHEDRSPYNAVSAMAGNPDLVSAECLVERGLLDDTHLDDLRSGSLSPGEARLVAAERFLAGDAAGDTSRSDRAAFEAWCAENRDWLDDYVEFVALREHLDRAPWPAWDPGLRDREPAAVAAILAPLADRLAVLRFEQWVFAEQWRELRDYAHARGVLLFGDLPIFVSHDSADVWASRDLFRLDDTGRPTTVTGVPPDYFSADGQRWNNPHYAWEAMARDGYRWWRERVAGQRRLFDLVRIDHFRGFEAAWHVPADADSAKDGHWERSPGAELLAALVGTSGPGTLVAEDLGTITPEVERLRREFGLPGMKVLQFAFDGDPDNWYLPANHEVLSVVYTGTHDNDTTLGWWAQQPAEQRRNVVPHLLDPTEPMPWALVRLAMASVATLAVVPAQDLLELGSESRMNTPGTPTGNWTWQAFEDDFDDSLAARLRELVTEHRRLV